MKKFLIIFCCVFTVIVLLTSFAQSRNNGSYYVNMQASSFGTDELVVNGQKYIVVTTPKGGIAICREEVFIDRIVERSEWVCPVPFFFVFLCLPDLRWTREGEAIFPIL